MEFDAATTLRGIVYALLEAVVIVAVAHNIKGRKFAVRELAMATLTVAVILFVLDLFAPAVGDYARRGAGFGVGLMLVGFSM